MDFNILGWKINISKKLINRKDIPEDLQEAIKVLQRYNYKAPSTKKQQEAAKKAAKLKAEKAKEKIESTLNMLRLQKEKKITTYLVAKEAGVSYNTAKKYESYWKKL